MLRNIVICDLDGTLADGQWRLHMLPPEHMRGIDSAWAEFNLAGQYDTLIHSTAMVIDALHRAGYYVIILTARGEISRDVTLRWLEKYCVSYHELIMRGIGDSRPDTEYKREVVQRLMDEGHTITCAFDDLPHVVDMLRGMGVTTYEVTRYVDDSQEYVRANNREEK